MKITNIYSKESNLTRYFLPLLLIFCVSVLGSKSYAQNCDSELSIYKNRDKRSVSENDPTKFQMELRNNSSVAQTYSIESANYSGECRIDGEENLKIDSNINFNIAIFQQDLKKSSITVPARTTAKFVVKVSVPARSPFNKWGCIEIKANSNACSNEATATVLKVFVRDPTDF